MGKTIAITPKCHKFTQQSDQPLIFRSFFMVFVKEIFDCLSQTQYNMTDGSLKMFFKKYLLKKKYLRDAMRSG
jgi:hypothetical protein